MSHLKLAIFAPFLLLAAVSLQGCGKKGDPQANCKAETFPPSYGQR